MRASSYTYTRFVTCFIFIRSLYIWALVSRSVSRVRPDLKLPAGGTARVGIARRTEGRMSHFLSIGGYTLIFRLCISSLCRDDLHTWPLCQRRWVLIFARMTESGKGIGRLESVHGLHCNMGFGFRHWRQGRWSIHRKWTE